MHHLYAQGLRIAVEGCGHGMLDPIYASINEADIKNNFKTDLLIICGDFQAVRNAADLHTMSVPPKYRTMADFYKYYNGTRVAPIPTVFVGGNHEASSHLWELFHGGWAAPNIYFLGVAGVVNVGGLRIGGLSGIYKSNDYNMPHNERLPYHGGALRSRYHIRSYDVLRMFQLSGKVDVFISHDWPVGIEQYGDVRRLVNAKKHFAKEIQENTLGSPPLMNVLHKMRPRFWFAAHLHVKFAAVVPHKSVAKASSSTAPTAATNPDELDLDLSDEEPSKPVEVKNDAEIDLDMDDEDEEPKPIQQATTAPAFTSHAPPPVPDPAPSPSDDLPYETQFLALDKCGPGKHFLQITPITASSPLALDSPARTKLYYDPEWLAIVRVFNRVFPSTQQVQSEVMKLGKDEGKLRELIAVEREWVQKNIVEKDLLQIPENFVQTAPPQFTDAMNIHQQPPGYDNPQTTAFCDLLQIDNKIKEGGRA